MSSRKADILQLTIFTNLKIFADPWDFRKVNTIVVYSKKFMNHCLVGPLQNEKTFNLNKFFYSHKLRFQIVVPQIS